MRISMILTDGRRRNVLDLPDEQINKKRRKEGEKKRKRKETPYVYMNTHIRINLFLECSLTTVKEKGVTLQYH
jgi:hypothetical protein